MEHALAPRPEEPATPEGRNRSQPPEPKADPKHKRFRADWPTIASAIVILLVAPISLACIVPFAWLLAVPLPGEWWHYSIAYYAVIPLALVPGMHWLQVLLTARDTREPNPEEQKRLGLLWNNVRRAARHEGPNRHQLRITDSAELNATARGTSIVTVTSGAMLMLPADQLEAVLAHELGHHTGLHTITGLMQWWLSRPLYWMNYAAYLLAALSVTLSRIASMWTSRPSQSGVGAFVKIAIQLALLAAFVVLRLLSWTIRGLLWIVTLVLRWTGRRAEFVADRYAVRLGYGAQMLAALSTTEDATEESSMPPGAVSWTDRLLASHPPMPDRARKITKEMQRLNATKNATNESHR